MGLDLYHLRAVKTPRNPEDFLDLDYFPQSVLDDDGFRQFVRDYETVELVHSVCFLVDQKAYEYRLNGSAGECGGSNTTLVPGPFSADEILRIESQMGLDPERRQITRCRVEAAGLKYVEESVLYFRPAIAQAIFYEEVGYQGKWMTGRFYERFNQSRVSVDRQSFLELPSFLYDDAPIGVRENLQRVFVDAFEPGSSMLFASW